MTEHAAAAPRSEMKLLIALLAVLIFVLALLEAASVYVAYHTLGEIPSLMYGLIVVAGNLGVLLLAWRSRRAAVVAALLLALAVVPYQVVLTVRLFRVQAEAARIVSHAYEERLRIGAYPADLTGYAFHDAAMRPFIQGYERNETDCGGFCLFYRVGTESTSHSYSPRNGWGYYPD